METEMSPVDFDTWLREANRKLDEERALLHEADRRLTDLERRFDDLQKAAPKTPKQS